MIRPETREQWLIDRRQGVGASEAAAILGLSPWTTPLEVYFRKIGASPEQEQTGAMKRGLRLERFIAEEYTEETGVAIEKPPLLMSHPSAPWMLASLDYWIPGDRVIQIKTADQWSKGFGEPGTSEVPEYYAIQVQQEMAVAQLPVAEIALLRVGSWTFDRYIIERNDALIEKLIEAEREFMDAVARRDPPLPDFTHPTTAQLLAMIEPEGGFISLGDEAVELANLYEVYGAKARELEADRKEFKSRLIYAMGTAEVAHLPDGRQITRKVVDRAGYTVQPTSYVDFRIKQPKKMNAR